MALKCNLNCSVNSLSWVFRSKKTKRRLSIRFAADSRSSWAGFPMSELCRWAFETPSSCRRKGFERTTTTDFWGCCTPCKSLPSRIKRANSIREFLNGFCRNLYTSEAEAESCISCWLPFMMPWGASFFKRKSAKLQNKNYSCIPY